MGLPVVGMTGLQVLFLKVAGLIIFWSYQLFNNQHITQVQYSSKAIASYQKFIV